MNRFGNRSYRIVGDDLLCNGEVVAHLAAAYPSLDMDVRSDLEKALMQPEQRTLYECPTCRLDWDELGEDEEVYEG